MTCQFSRASASAIAATREASTGCRGSFNNASCNCRSAGQASGGGKISARSLDARKEDDLTAFLNDADKHAPLEVCVFNIGANVNFPLLETTDRVFRKVWEMACYSGFIAGREAARLMVPRERGNIFFTGATASVRGGIGYAAFAAAKFGLRAVAQSAARELGPKNIHVAHLIIDAGVDTAFAEDAVDHDFASSICSYMRTNGK